MAYQINTHNGVLWVETCCRCKTPFAMSDEIYKVAKQQAEEGTFCCPHGHEQHYVSGETEADKLRRERDQLKQRTAYLEDMRREADERANKEGRRAAAFKGQTTRLRNRAKAGICPCCNRHFENLQRHMDGQHPDFEAEPQEPADA